MSDEHRPGADLLDWIGAAPRAGPGLEPDRERALLRRAAPRWTAGVAVPRSHRCARPGLAGTGHRARPPPDRRLGARPARRVPLAEAPPARRAQGPQTAAAPRAGAARRGRAGRRRWQRGRSLHGPPSRAAHAARARGRARRQLARGGRRAARRRGAPARRLVRRGDRAAAGHPPWVRRPGPRAVPADPGVRGFPTVGRAARDRAPRARAAGARPPRADGIRCRERGRAPPIVRPGSDGGSSRPGPHRHRAARLRVRPCRPRTWRARRISASRRSSATTSASTSSTSLRTSGGSTSSPRIASASSPARRW